MRSQVLYRAAQHIEWDMIKTEGQLTCMACSTEDTVASRLEWHAAPADAASSSASDISNSEALRPLMLMLSVLGRRCVACLGPLL